MAAKLKRSVLNGGKVYPAGTEATDALRKKIPARFWDDADSAPAPDGGDLAEVRQLAASQIAEHEKTIADLNAQIAALKADNDDLRNQIAATADDGDDNKAATKVDYTALDLDALKAEIDKRNEGRDDDQRISKRGSVETLAAALTADDARTSGAES